MTINKAQTDLLAGLMAKLNAEDRTLCRTITDCLAELGYMPQKQKINGCILSFRNSRVQQTIAKVGLRDTHKKAFFSLKFYACKNPPPQYAAAVKRAILTTSGQYACCDCRACGAGKEDRGYRVAGPDGLEFVRCGAYVIEIPDLGPDDLDDFCTLLREQHQYFIQRCQPPANKEQTAEVIENPESE